MRAKRFLPTLFLCAAAAVALTGCYSSGPDSSTPTGPSSKYNPQIDYPGAKITATGPDTAYIGTGFDVVATFVDGNGHPVEGIPLIIVAENSLGRVNGYFSFITNPTLTDGNGHASLGVKVLAGCPEESFTFHVFTQPADPAKAPTADGYAHVHVKDGHIPAVSAVTLTTTTPSVTVPTAANFIATVDANAYCDLVVQYEAAGVLTAGWTNTPTPSGNPNLFSIDTSTVGTTGTLTVVARAYCSNSTPPIEYVVSSPVNIAVTGP
jgi:hypothetical protein